VSPLVLFPKRVLHAHLSLPLRQRLRPLSYSKSHVILIAFAIDTPDSLENVSVKVGSGSFWTRFSLGGAVCRSLIRSA